MKNSFYLASEIRSKYMSCFSFHSPCLLKTPKDIRASFTQSVFFSVPPMCQEWGRRGRPGQCRLLGSQVVAGHPPRSRGASLPALQAATPPVTYRHLTQRHGKYSVTFFPSHFREEIQALTRKFQELEENKKGGEEDPEETSPEVGLSVFLPPVRHGGTLS